MSTLRSVAPHRTFKSQENCSFVNTEVTFNELNRMTLEVSSVLTNEWVAPLTQVDLIAGESDFRRKKELSTHRSVAPHRTLRRTAVCEH